jgi:fucose-1-phosphate guanylyltransferase
MYAHSVRTSADDSAAMRAWSQQKYEAYVEGCAAAEAAGAAAAAGGGWDVIVITAADAGQQAAYEAQVQSELEQGHLPSRSDWLVVADKPGPKIGAGGSTLYVLSLLQSKYGDKLDEMRVLMIHAGGYSQRLPSMSVCGKIFAAMPVSRTQLGGGDTPCTMLQLKLAMFAQLPYPGKMVPGVFVTCADDILIFDSAVCDFTSPGFTALAHRSPLVTAAGHGVFSLPGDGMKMGPAEAFVHKPSESRMREKGLVHTTTHEDGTVEEWAFTDSAFFFDRSIAKRLLAFYEDELGGNLACEIDCYGDFLQPLGPKADDSYLGNTTSNIVAGTGGSDSELVTVRKALWSLLQGTTLHVLPLHPSRFYHIGTFVEYLHFIARDRIFAQEVITQNSINVKGKPQHQKPLDEGGAADAAELEHPPPPTLLNCEIRGDAGVGIVGAGSVVEFSVLGEHATIGTDCLVSGVELTPGCVVPDQTFLQTWAQTVEGSDGVQGYVAHVIATTDDIKKVMNEDQSEPPIAWLGRGIGDACDALGIELEAVWPDPSKPKNLWEAKIFPTGSSAAEATSRAVSMLTAVRGGGAPGDLAWLREEGGPGQLQSLSGSLQLSSAAAQTKLRAAMAHGIEEVRPLQSTLQPCACTPCVPNLSLSSICVCIAGFALSLGPQGHSWNLLQ